MGSSVDPEQVTMKDSNVVELVKSKQEFQYPLSLLEQEGARFSVSL